MKEKIKIVLIAVLALALAGGGAVWYHNSSLKKVKAALADEQAQRALMEERVTEITGKLDEDSMTVYDEDSGLFNPITLGDASDIRKKIKNEAEVRAIKNGLLSKAKNRAQEMIEHIIFAVPGIKDTYTIRFM